MDIAIDNFADGVFAWFEETCNQKEGGKIQRKG